jgi:ribosomal protein S18 acetylase RimI-like enzyme
MATTSSFRTANESDQASITATLVSAFIEDPVERWLFPEPRGYLSQFPQFIAAFGGEAFSRGTVWEMCDFAAVAMWIPPGAEPDVNKIVQVLTNCVSPEKHADTFAVLEQMDRAHPTYPHWYLPWLGVDSPRRGAGLGSDLLKQCLNVVDADHLPAFLETPNPRTIQFYERHGFEVSSVAEVGACPPVTSMTRAAR